MPVLRELLMVILFLGLHPLILTTTVHKATETCLRNLPAQMDKERGTGEGTVMTLQ